MKTINPEMKLVVTESNKIIETVVTETDAHPSHMLKSLNDFRQLVNAALTKLIENSEDSSDTMDDEEASSEEDENDVQVSPKKKKL